LRWDEAGVRDSRGKTVTELVGHDGHGRGAKRRDGGSHSD
jgi:hypothetical protein